MYRIKKSLKVLAYLCAFLVGMYLLQHAFPELTALLGLKPRNINSLPTVFTTHFLHASWFHLGQNLTALVVLAALTLIKGHRYFYRSSLFIIMLTGILMWCFARPGVHIGASGWVFGLWSLLIVRAVFDKRLSSFVIAIIVLIFYGGMVFGLMPGKAHISFEAHIFGAITGFFCAYFKIGKRS